MRKKLTPLPEPTAFTDALIFPPWRSRPIWVSQRVNTAISRKVNRKNVLATIPKGNMGYDQYIVPDPVAVESSIVAFL